MAKFEVDLKPLVHRRKISFFHEKYEKLLMSYKLQLIFNRFLCFPLKLDSQKYMLLLAYMWGDGVHKIFLKKFSVGRKIRSRSPDEKFSLYRKRPPQADGGWVGVGVG